MYETTGVFVLPVFKLDKAIDEELGAALNENDLVKLASVMHRNLVDIFQSCGLQKIYSIGEPQDYEQADIFHNLQQCEQDNIDQQSIIRAFIEREIKSLERIILINENVVGLTPGILGNILNLLELEEDVNVVLFDEKNRCCGSCFLNYSYSFLENCMNGLNFETFFQITPEDRFWITMNNMHSVASKQDFKNLYMVLSNRGNIDYCRKEFYDTFTELFIDYKDLLK